MTAIMSTVRRVTLQRRLGSLVANGCLGALGIPLFFFFFLSASDRPFAERLAVSLYPLAFTILGFVGVAFLAIPVVVEVDDDGLRLYRRGHIRRNLPWSDVTWVAFGRWSVAVVTVGMRKTALCVLVRGRRVRKSIGMNDVSYKLSTTQVNEFGKTVAQMAEARSIPVLPRPRL